MTAERCEEAARLSAAGETDERQAKALAAHLDHCPICRGLAEHGMTCARGGATDEPLGAGLRTQRAAGRPTAADGPLGGGPAGGEPSTVDLPPGGAPPTDGEHRLETVGKYTLARRLDRGGMGEVYEGLDPVVRRRVAVKLLRDHLRADPAARRRFLREARTAGGLTCDHIVRVYEAGEDQGRDYLVMELLEGQSLHLRLRDGPLAADEVVRIGQEVALGLEAAHRAGIIHRDVKPGNIWLEKREGQPARAKLLDFGLARVVADDFQGTPAHAGTVGFQPPEQVQENRVGERGDLYSLGCVLYQMATGRPPFPAGPAPDVWKRQQHGSPPPPHEVQPTVPRPLSDLVVQMLHPDPEQRPASAGEVVRRLEELRTSPPRRRGWVVAAVVGLLLAVAAAVAYFVFAPVTPVRVEEFEIEGFRGKETVGVIGQTCTAMRPGDDARVRVRFSAPAFAYLVALNPDGSTQLCHPADEQTPPDRAAEVHFPAAGKDGFPLTEGTGLQAFAVVASRQRLPAYAAWKAAWDQAGAPRPPWPPNRESQLIYGLHNGRLSVLDKDERGQVRPLQVYPKPFLDVCEFLQGRPEFDTVEVLAFPVKNPDP